MAVTIRVFNQADSRYYTVTIDMFSSVLDLNDIGENVDVSMDYYLKINTTMRKRSDNSAFPEYLIRTLNDVPPIYGTPANFTELIDDYVDYFVNQAELGMSSSSSSSSMSSNSSGSSSSISSNSSSSKSSGSSSSRSSNSSSSGSSSSSSNP